MIKVVPHLPAKIGREAKPQHTKRTVRNADDSQDRENAANLSRSSSVIEGKKQENQWRKRPDNDVTSDG
jgi:hypothetical protein